MIAPEVDRDSAPFWAMTADHRLVVPVCNACAWQWFPNTPACPHCGATDITLREHPGTGEVYSWVRVHRALSAAFAEQAPYVIATVALDGGGRVFGRLEGPAAIGARVRARYVDHGGWTELRFEATGGGDDPGGQPR